MVFGVLWLLRVQTAVIARPRVELAEPDLPLPASSWDKFGKWAEWSEDQPPDWQPGDEACAACTGTVLFAAPVVVARWTPTDEATHWWHPGCWTSYQEHRRACGAVLAAIIGFPPVRGLGDGKSLQRAAGG